MTRDINFDSVDTSVRRLHKLLDLNAANVVVGSEFFGNLMQLVFTAETNAWTAVIAEIPQSLREGLHKYAETYLEEFDFSPPDIGDFLAGTAYTAQDVRSLQNLLRPRYVALLETLQNGLELDP